MPASPDSVELAHLTQEGDIEQLRVRVQQKLRKLQTMGVGGNAPGYLLDHSHTAGSLKLHQIEQAADASLKRAVSG